MKPRSLSCRVLGVATGGAAGALLVAGLSMAGVLYYQAARDLDRTLLVATQAPVGQVVWVNPYVSSPVRVRLWAPGDGVVSSAWAAQAARTEAPMFRDVGADRVLLLQLEPPGTALVGEGHPHRLVIASAPRVRWPDTIGSFLSVGLALSVGLVLITGLVLSRMMRTAMEPLVRTRQALDKIVGVGVGVRLARTQVEEVDDVVDGVNALLQRLDTAYTAQVQFTAEAAHELRTPLTVMAGELDLALIRPRTAEEYADAIRRARGSAYRLNELVSGLMGLARVDAGQVEQQRVREHISFVVTEALEQELPTLEDHGCEVKVRLGDDPELDVHISLLCNALSNLLRNAALHAPGSRVEVEVRQQGQWLLIDVRDQGPGIPRDKWESVFERFRRGGGRGLGLGLPLARAVVERHGGTLRIQPSDRGAHFEMMLPLPEDSA